jgi:hypothetical protein
MQLSLQDRKRLILMLMRHREVDVNNCIERVYDALGVPAGTWLKNVKFVRHIEELRADLDDIDIAIIDVLLANSKADAESIVAAFWVR